MTALEADVVDVVLSSNGLPSVKFLLIYVQTWFLVLKNKYAHEIFMHGQWDANDFPNFDTPRLPKPATPDPPFEE